MRVFLAATSGLKEEVIEKGKPIYLLETFFAGERACAKALSAVGVENFLLDSGAFSFMSGAKCTKELIEGYMDKYIAFINKYNVKYFFELDVDTIFGIEFVEELRRKLERETGKQCIPVWHKGRGIEYWKRMCREYKYVAIGGLVFHVKKAEYPLIKKMVDYAYSKGVKVHGLGFTKTKDLPKYKFFSVDSSSWIAAASRGRQMNTFNGKHIEGTPVISKDKKVSITPLGNHNFYEWCKYQKYMESKRW